MKKQTITLQEKAYADLIIAGWKQAQAYPIVFPETNAKSNSINTIASRIANTPHIKDYITQKVAIKKEGKNKIDEIDIDLTQIDKTELSKHLTILFYNETDPKLKSELGMKIAELNQFKKGQTETQQQVKYYLPLPDNELISYISERIKTDGQFADNIRLTLDNLSQNIANK